MNVKYQLNTLTKWQCVIFMAALCLLTPRSGYAQKQWQPHADLEAAATQFLDQYFEDRYELKLKFGKLDSRLRLAKCEPARRVFLPSNRKPIGSISMGVRCIQPSWKVHIPVRVQAFTQVLVATRPIVKNSIINQADLQFVRQDISRYSAGIFTQPEHLIGMVAKRSIRHDAVITPRMVKPKRLVNRGDVISIIAEANGLTIRTSGKALMDGHQGQIIQVKNNRSGRQISAEVIARSTVKVRMQ